MSLSLTNGSFMDTESHNAITKRNLSRGDLIEFQRGLYSHWAVYIGNGMVIHLAGEDTDGIDDLRPEYVFSISGKTFNKAKVCIDKLDDVILGNKIFINNSKDTKWTAYHPDKVIEMALSKVGDVGYSVMTKNCEHFAKWCRYGVPKSDQVDNVITGVAVATAAGLTAGLIAAVAKYWGEDTNKEKKRKA